MQNEIPDAWNQIPSRKVVEETPGYSMFAHEFPEKQEDWETILLIGRDCMEAQWQDQYYSAENNSQMVAKTPLGWTLIGSPPQKDPPPASRRQQKGKEKKSQEDSHAYNFASQELDPNFCIIHTNSHSCPPDHHSRECEDFVGLSPKNKWMIVNQERICPLCITAQHLARKCPLRNGATMCQNCHYTHAREMGCRPPETIRRQESWHCLNIAPSQHRDESTREILLPSPPAKPPKKKSKKKKRSRAATRKKLPPPQRMESPRRIKSPKYQPGRERRVLYARKRMSVGRRKVK